MIMLIKSMRKVRKKIMSILIAASWYAEVGADNTPLIQEMVATHSRYTVTQSELPGDEVLYRLHIETLHSLRLEKAGPLQAQIHLHLKEVAKMKVSKQVFEKQLKTMKAGSGDYALFEDNIDQLNAQIKILCDMETKVFPTINLEKLHALTFYGSKGNIMNIDNSLTSLIKDELKKTAIFHVGVVNSYLLKYTEIERYEILDKIAQHVIPDYEIRTKVESMLNNEYNNDDKVVYKSKLALIYSMLSAHKTKLLEALRVSRQFKLGELSVGQLVEFLRPECSTLRI